MIHYQIEIWKPDFRGTGPITQRKQHHQSDQSDKASHRDKKTIRMYGQ